ncbi:MAG: CPBP family intramembrane glutamic endopeptidase, partial [Planctomycetota bacterium]
MIAAVEPAALLSLVVAASGAFGLLVILRRSAAGRPILHVAERPFRPGPASTLLVVAAGLFLAYAGGGMLLLAPGTASKVLGLAVPLMASAVALVLARRAVLLPRGSAKWRIGVGLLYLWASLPLVYGTYLLCLQWFPEQTSVALLRERSDGWQALALAAVLVAPVAEETCFRGLLYPALRTQLSARGAIVVSSLAFALVHQPAVYLPMAILGAFLAWLVETTGSVLPSIAAHMA